jgi:hypothetical protein
VLLKVKDFNLKWICHLFYRVQYWQYVRKGLLLLDMLLSQFPLGKIALVTTSWTLMLNI